MKTQRRSCSSAMVADRVRRVANDHSRTSPSRTAGRAIVLAIGRSASGADAGCTGAAKRRRERVLACLAFIMLIVAWDATLRLDERVAPPRMRMAHAVEHEAEPQTQGYVP